MNHSIIKKLIALLLCLLTIASVTTFAITASAASYGSDYWNHTEPSGSDYAYWNGKKMVKHKGTTTDNVKWMQTMFNWFIDQGYISCAKLEIDGNYGPKCKSVCQAWQRRAGISVDGSCGPQTIAKMKSERNRLINSSKNNTYTSCEFIWPIANGSGTVTAVPGSRSYEKHVGTDIGTSGQNPAIIAVAAGTVIKADHSGARGYYVTIRHGSYICVYQHMKASSTVKAGQTVSQGQVIGYVGNTGNSSGTHLHFEMVLERSLSKKNSLTECLWADINYNRPKPVYYSISRGSKIGNYYKLNMKQV